MRIMKTSAKTGQKDGVDAVHEPGAEHHAHGVEVVGHAGHHVAGAVALIEAGILAFEFAEEVVAEVELDVAGDADEHPALGVEEDAFADGDDDEEACEEDNVLPCGSVFQIVDGTPKDAGELDPDGVGANTGESAPDVSPAIASHVDEEGGAGRAA